MQNSIKYNTLLCTASLVQNLKESDIIWGNYTQNTTQKQLKIHFSGTKKTFANSYLGNRKYDTNETYHDYVSPWDLWFGKKLGRHP